MKTNISLSKTAVVCTLVAMAAVHDAWAGDPGVSPGRKLTTNERLEEAHLDAAHRDAAAYQSSRKTLPPFFRLNDYRAILHAHAEDSAHTGGTLPEMLQAAKMAGVQVIMLTDHYRPPKDFMDGWRGLKDEVLFIPGSEAKGFLLYPDASITDTMDAPKEDLIAATGAGTGLLFLSHVEQRMDHDMDGVSGMEIYNRHADAMDDMGILITLMGYATDPGAAKEFQRLLELYPDEVLACQLDYPSDYMEKWDRETLLRPIIGIAANDCHHNQVFIVKMIDAETVRVGTIVDDDEDMRVVSAKLRPGILEMTKGHSAGDVLVKFDLDPYDTSFHTVSTHILSETLDETAIRDALHKGRVYVSHDWMCDPTGFRFFGMNRLRRVSKARGEPTLFMLGDEIGHDQSLLLTAQFPVECSIRVIKDGEIMQVTKGSELKYSAKTPGVYRVEGWLTIDGEERPWIYSNPIYAR